MDGYIDLDRLVDKHAGRQVNSQRQGATETERVKT